MARERLSDATRQAAALRRFEAAQQPVTRTLVCPIDILALEEFALTRAAEEVPRDKHGQAVYGGSYRDIIARYLSRVQRGEGGGYVRVDYRHTKLGAGLKDAGLVSESREYAMRADRLLDPFALPKRLRTLALARYGFDFDDAGSPL